jgi:hypothetical protein
MSAQEQMSGSPSMWKRLRELEVELVQVKRDHMADVRALNERLKLVERERDEWKQRAERMRENLRAEMAKEEKTS